MTAQKIKSSLFLLAFYFNLFCVFVVIMVVFTHHVKIEDAVISVFLNLIDAIKEDSIKFLRGGNFADPEDFANILRIWLL
jgi:hypothetical protein